MAVNLGFLDQADYIGRYLKCLIVNVITLSPQVDNLMEEEC
jgi:hypothetical protein